MQVARREVQRAARSPEPKIEAPVEEHIDEELLRPGGAFVTLHRGRHLRGCIGQLPSDEALVSVVAHCAKAAATEDPRFKAVRGDEIAKINIEISVLSPLVDAGVEEIQPGTHGIVLTKGTRRGVLLPQVAEKFHWSAIRFLEETCVKAELDRNAWKDPEAKVQIFTAEIFSEPAYSTSSAGARVSDHISKA